MNNLKSIETLNYCTNKLEKLHKKNYNREFFYRHKDLNRILELKYKEINGEESIKIIKDGSSKNT